MIFSIFFLSPVSDARSQPAPVNALPADSIVVTIFHSNDVYGEIARRRSSDGFFGGMAPRIRLIRQARQLGPVLTLDAGNALGPAPISAWDQGTVMIDLMRLAGYAAMLPANHEFDFGAEILKRQQHRAGFPFLGTNLSVDGETALFSRHLLVETAGLRIGVLGLLSQEAAILTNPEHFNGIQITDPLESARSEIEVLQVQGADYIIALTHMEEAETLAFARQAKGVHLVIAGGYRQLDQADLIPGLIQLVNGTQIVTTPGSGRFLGQVTVQFVQRPGGGYLPAVATARLHAIDYKVSDDLDAAALIAQAENRYAMAARDTIGLIAGDSHQNQVRMMAQLMRRRTDAEIGILNMGLIQQIPVDQALIRRHISRFIRFPNTLHIINLTGAQLRSAISFSSTANRLNARLIFAGLDANTLTVEGRPLTDNEQYRVATTDFLANGGDGYEVFTQSPLRIDTGITLRTLLQETLQPRGRLTSDSYRQGSRRGVWHSGLQVEGAFERNYVDKTTEIYRAQNEQAPFLSGATTVAWNGALRYFLERENGPHVTRYENRMDFSQVGKSFGELTPSTDELGTEIRYRYRALGSRGDPFISVGFNTAFTNAGGKRPMQVLSTIGFEYQPFQSLIARVAGRSQRDFVADKSDLGGELTLEWTRPMQSGALLSSRVRSFFGVTNRRVVSIENYNTVSFPLLGDVRLNIRQNNFLYRVNRIGGVATEGVAFRTIITVGFAYGLNWKWL